MGRGQAGLAALALLLLGACVRSPSLQGPSSYEEAARLAPEGTRRASAHLVALADRDLARGDLGSARDRAGRAVRIDPRNPYAFLLLGRVAAASGDRRAALRRLDQAQLLFALEEPPNPAWRARALERMAVLLEQEGRAGAAGSLRDLARALARGQEGAGSPPGPVLETLR